MPLRIVPARDRTIHRLFMKGDSVRLRRGQRLYQVGDAATDVYMVEEGHIRLMLPALRGQPATASSGKPASGRRAKGRVGGLVGVLEVFGLEAISESTRLYGAVAGEPTRLRSTAGAQLLRRVRRTRWTLPELVAAIERDLQAARWGLSAHAPARARVARALLSLDGRFGAPEGKGGIPRRLSHSEVADVAGVHRSTVTTIVNEWIYDGLLEELRGDRLLQIRSADALRKEAYLA